MKNTPLCPYLSPHNLPRLIHTLVLLDLPSVTGSRILSFYFIFSSINLDQATLAPYLEALVFYINSCPSRLFPTGYDIHLAMLSLSETLGDTARFQSDAPSP